MFLLRKPILALSANGAVRNALTTTPITKSVVDRFIPGETSADAVAAVQELTDGIGVDGACECVGTAASWETALDLVRPGGTVGWVGVPHDVKDGLPIWKLFGRNISVRGGVAPARAYLPELLPEVLSGALDPGPIFTQTVSLDDIAAGYRAMDERRAVKVLVRP